MNGKSPFVTRTLDLPPFWPLDWGPVVPEHIASGAAVSWGGNSPSNQPTAAIHMRSDGSTVPGLVFNHPKPGSLIQSPVVVVPVFLCLSPPYHKFGQILVTRSPRNSQAWSCGDPGTTAVRCSAEVAAVNSRPGWYPLPTSVLSYRWSDRPRRLGSQRRHRAGQCAPKFPVGYRPAGPGFIR